MTMLVNLEQVIDWASGCPRSLACRHVLVLSFCLLWWRELRRKVDLLEDCHHVRASAWTHIWLLVLICEYGHHMSNPSRTQPWQRWLMAKPVTRRILLVAAVLYKIESLLQFLSGRRCLVGIETVQSIQMVNEVSSTILGYRGTFLMLKNWPLKLSDGWFNHLHFLLFLIPWRYLGHNLRASYSLNLLSYCWDRWYMCCCCLSPISEVLLLIIIELAALNHEYNLLIGCWDRLTLKLLLDGLLVQLIRREVSTRVGYHSSHEEWFVTCIVVAFENVLHSHDIRIFLMSRLRLLREGFIEQYGI